jgi:uncharacterized protein (DUF2164 family)
MEIIKLSSEAQKELIEQIKRYYATERDEAISDFQAENFLRFILSVIGPAIYNQAIEDAYTLMNEKADDLFGLQKRITI